MSDIATRLGISQASVSLVLNDAPGTRISQVTRERVLAVAAELGYQKASRSTAANGVIGFLINDLTTTQHLAGLLEGARDEAAENGCLLSIFSTRSDPRMEVEALDQLASRPLVGVIYACLLTQAVQPPARLRQISTVLLNCHAAGDPFPSVVPGDVAGGFSATAALLEAGHRRIAMINGEDWIEAARDRLQGYRQALTTHDVAVDPRLILSGGWTLASGREQMFRLLDAAASPTAVFCFCDRMALGAYEAVRERGLRIPDDVSIVGFDNEVFAADMSPPLTTVELPHDQMARLAVRRLIENSSGSKRDPLSRRLKVECRLVPRRSIRNV